MPGKEDQVNNIPRKETKSSWYQCFTSQWTDQQFLIKGSHPSQKCGPKKNIRIYNEKSIEHSILLFHIF